VAIEPGGLRALLLTEIERHGRTLRATDRDPSAVRGVLHALRGSAALAGEHDLSLVLAQLSTRSRHGDTQALLDMHELLEGVRERLAAGLPALPGVWPEPPPGLVPSQIDERYRIEYLSAMRERVVELETATRSELPPAEILKRAYRTVHAMKGAATSVGDDATAWYCHGLETRLRVADPAQGGWLAELAQQRMLIGLFVEDPAQALLHLRWRAGDALSGEEEAAADRASKSQRPSRPPLDDEGNAEDLTLPVRGSMLDRFLERLELMDVVHEELTSATDVARQMAQHMRDMRESLLSALRQIGPPRPWGAPAAALQRIETTARSLGVTAGNAERGAQLFRRNAELVRARSREMRADLSSLRRTSVGWLFERVANAAERLAAGEGRLVHVQLVGTELAIDRRVAERLLDPVLQLARNAVAHGIASPGERLQAGKPAEGTLLLEAQRIGDWLRIIVEDDGRGVDLDKVRELAFPAGAGVSRGSESAHEDEVLSLLFAPGLTTQPGADLLAGRGVGLDLARDAVRRLGGAVRLSNRAGGGLTATIEVPSERGVLDVVWVTAADQEFGLPVSFTGKLQRLPVKGPVATLASCLGLRTNRPAVLALELAIHGVQTISIGIENLGRVEETHIRPIPRLVAVTGPYAGAILRGDGSLRLVLDAALLAAGAWGQATASV
jgi:two-component system chemotaxis sensor kinase CheA